MVHGKLYNQKKPHKLLNSIKFLRRGMALNHVEGLVAISSGRYGKTSVYYICCTKSTYRSISRFVLQLRNLYPQGPLDRLSI